MTDLNTDSHSFVVKIWLEDRIKTTGKAVWRGHITHVFGGERRYVQDLDGITMFIAPYLDHMGAKLSPCWRIRQWIEGWRIHLRQRYHDESKPVSR